MKLRVATPRDGVQWMLSGIRLARQHPLGLAGLFVLQIFGLALLLSLPWIGPVLVAAMLPALSAGWVQVSTALQAGDRPQPLQLLEPLRTVARPALLRLGALNALGSFLLLMLADLIDPSMAEAWSTMHEDTPNAIGALQQGMVLRAALLLPLTLTLWHAPVILMRTDAGLGKALFISANATWRNFGAFVVFGVCWLVADLVLSLLLAGLLTALGLGPVALLLVLPCAIVFSAAFYASLRASVEGCIDFEN